VASQRTASRQGTDGGIGAKREVAWSDVMYDSTIAQSLVTVSMPVYSSLNPVRDPATDYLVGVVSALVFADGLNESLSSSDIPDFAQSIAANMSLVSAYLAFHGMDGFKDRCHVYTGSNEFEQALRYELFNYTCSVEELVSNHSDSESVDLVLVSSGVPVTPSGTAVEHCPVVSLSGPDLWENPALPAFSTSIYRDQRCPLRPEGCKTYDVSRAQIRDETELVFSMECVDASATLQYPVVWVLAAALSITILLRTV